MAQPGDPYAAQRARPRSELFKDTGGQLNEYARRAHLRTLADLRYLATWRTLGPQEAGRRVCEEFGHEATGGQCPRCGAVGLR